MRLLLLKWALESSAPLPAVLRGLHPGPERHTPAAVPPQWGWPVLPSQMTGTRWWLPTLGDHLSDLLGEPTIPLSASDTAADSLPDCIGSLRYMPQLDQVLVEARLTPQPMFSLLLPLLQEPPLTM